MVNDKPYFELNQALGQLCTINNFYSAESVDLGLEAQACYLIIYDAGQKPVILV